MRIGPYCKVLPFFIYLVFIFFDFLDFGVIIEGSLSAIRKCDIAQLVSELRLCVVNAALSECRWWWFTTNHESGFTDEMRMIIEFD